MLAVIQQSIASTLSLFLIGLVGYVLAKRGWFGDESKAMLPRLVTLITLPPYLFHNVMTSFSRDDLVHLIYGSGVPAASITLAFLASCLMTRFLKQPQGRRGIFKTGVFTSNTMFIGLPVNIALFGQEAIPYVLLYFFANTTAFWTLGNYLISLDGDRSRQEKILSLTTLKRICSPPFLGFVTGLALVMLNFSPPAFFMDAAGYVGGMTTPMALIFIGIGMAGIKLRQLRIDRDLAMLLFGRFILSPASIILLTRLVELPPLMTSVFIIQSALPMGTSTALLAGYYRADSQFASVAASLTTLMSLISIPLAMVVITLLR